MAVNGRLPLSELAPIPGSGPYGAPKLRRDAAAAYNALHKEALRRWGISMALHEGVVGRAYRAFERQVLAKRTYGANAADPGESNHGWGINVDLMNRQQRWVIDQIGHLYGFSKRWSDAAWEWWHITFKPGIYKAVAAARARIIRPGVSPGNDIRTLQVLLRQAGYLPTKWDAHRSYTATVQGAVKRLQRAHKLPEDGEVGPKTWSAARAAAKRKRSR